MRDLTVTIAANGTKQCRATAVRRLTDGSEEILAVDQLNPLVKDKRKSFTEMISSLEERRDVYDLLTECADELGSVREANAEKQREAGLEESDLSEDSITLAFTERYGSTLRFTAAWSKWHEWDGTRWTEDTTLSVFDKSRSLCRSIAERQSERAARVSLRSAKTFANVERMSRADRRHAARPDQWDANPWVLGTPNGVVDLRKGSLRKAQPEDYITKQTSVAPGNGCARWLEFLEWATGGDGELIAFLQRMSGYMLTGSTREHALFFPYGTGGNGKGTMVNTFTGIMGDYATVAPMETFTESHGDRHPTELAMLRGSRLVASQETERGRKWAESRVKALTGGDPITARFMRQDFFTFPPEFKLLIAGNERPAIASVDEAIRRRFHLIPFEQQITASQRDEQLPEKLRAEWPGILAWMIEGTQLWIEQGLRPPPRVQAATQAYLDEQDSFGAWIEEACNTGPREWASSADLFASWESFCSRSGEKPGTMKGLGSELTKRGFVAKAAGHTRQRGFLGLAIRRDSANAYNARGIG